MISLEQFTDETAIDPMYVDRAYYLAPDGQVAADAYAVMREGMQGKVGIGKVAIYGREYLVAIKPHKQGLVMYTLHHAAEIRTIDQIEELETVPRTVKPAEMKLAKQVVEIFEGELNLKDYKDEYKEGLQENHRRPDCRRRVRRRRSRRGAQQGRGPDGGAAQEPRCGQRGKKKPAKADLTAKKSVAKAEPKRKRA